MPIFEFRCDPCNTTFESLLRSRDDEPDPCPGCGSKDVKRLLSVFGVGASDSASSDASSCSRPGCAPRARA